MGNFFCLRRHQRVQQEPDSTSVFSIFHRSIEIRHIFADRLPNFILLRSSPPDGIDVDIFSYQEMSDATGSWDNGKIIGQGLFGRVYKGLLRANLRPKYVNDIQVAIKKYSEERLFADLEWLSEIRTLGKFRHPNLVKLIGYCCRHYDIILVYEYMENGSLFDHLDSNQVEVLSWPRRMKIALHAARGLAFLHGQERPIICRDFKSADILLDKDFNAKISDLGLAREGPRGNQAYVSTRILGTPRYMAPEYSNTGHLTKYCDIYSFGVVLLELLLGCSVYAPKCRANIVDMAFQNFHEDDNILKMVDPSLVSHYEETALKVAKLARKCINRNPWERPEMSKVLKILKSVQKNAVVMELDVTQK